MSTRNHADRGIGFTALFGILAAAAAVLVYVAPTQALSAVGFAGVVVFGSLLIVVQQYYA